MTLREPPSRRDPLAASLLVFVFAGCSTSAVSSTMDGSGAATDAATNAPDSASGTSDGATGTPDAGDDKATRCALIGDSIHAAGFDDKVTVRCDAQYAWIAGDTYPAHDKMTGITGTNDQVPVPAPGYRSPIALVPVKATTNTSIDAALGVAVNGVPIYDYSSQGTLDLTTYDPRMDTKLTGELDLCNGHSGRGDDYHYHAAPVCMIAAMKNAGPAAILGWGFDGYPLYGDTNPDGSALKTGELDVCNAKPDPHFGYRYHTSQGHPYVMQCLVGKVDLAVAPRVPPLGRAAGVMGPGKPPGNKPPGGVQNLKLVEDASGQRTMTYDWQGKHYAIAYRPSTTAGCWDFEETSYTSGGVLQKNTWCRSTP